MAAVCLWVSWRPWDLTQPGSFASFSPRADQFHSTPNKQTFLGVVGTSQMGHFRTHAPQQRCVLFDQFVGRKQRWGGEAPACSGIGVVVQRFAIGPGVMVTRSTSATVG